MPKEKNVKTKYFGEINFSEADKITFDNGMFGFDTHKEFALINFEAGQDTMVNLQSLEDENLSFVLMNPFYLLPDYQTGLSEQEMRLLGINEDTKGVLFYVVCVVKEHIKDSTVNLRCPIVINPETRKGVQIMLDNPKYTFKHPLSDFAVGGY